MIRSAWADHPGYRIDLVPCRGTARVVVDGVVVAESTRAVRLIETDHVERLYLPSDDVRADLIERSQRTSVCPFKGQASYWSLRAGPGGPPPVEDLFWEYGDPFPEVAGIRGLVGVYHEKADVEVETTWPDGGQARTAFPGWGDLSDLQTLLDVQPTEEGRFAGPGYHERSRNVVEGGQLLGQAIVAASRTLPDQRVTWASATFIRAADFDDEVEIEVEPLRRGRTFSTLEARSSQRGRLVSPSLILMDAGAPDTIRDTEPMPDVPPPERCEPYDMRMTGRDVRVVEGAYDPDPDRVGPPVIHAWMRMREDPTELSVRQALLSYASTHWTIAAAMRPHPGVGEALAHVSLSTGPVALSMSFHDDAPLDDWFLYSTRAIWSGLGLAQGESRIWSADGRLMASYSLQAMVRAMLSGASGRDAARAM